ncbi:hypothetical protein D3C78_1932200 [compost metagenome]
MLVETAHGAAQLRSLVIDAKHAATQLHHGHVECSADRREFITTHDRHLQTQIAIAQGFGE